MTINCRFLFGIFLITLISTTAALPVFGPCDFEFGQCDWTSTADNSPIWAWERALAGLSVTPDAPTTDHTRLGEDGHYLISYPTSTNLSDYFLKDITSVATSSTFRTNRRHCLIKFYTYASQQFSYVVEFGIKVKKSLKKLWKLGVSDFGKWVGATIDIGYQPDEFQLYLRHVILKSFSKTMPGAVAFDDFSFIDCESLAEKPACKSFEFQCSNKTCIPRLQVCDGSDQCGDGSDEDRSGECRNRLVINFEDQQDNNVPYLVAPAGTNGDVNMPWTRISGQTPTDDTGPRFDYTLGNEQGHYLYFSAKNQTKAFSKAWLVLKPTIVAKSSTAGCSVRFRYHMYGGSIGTLSVYYRTAADGPVTKLWSRQGERGDLWLSASIKLNALKSDYQLIFEAMGSEGNTGDMAIDDISLSEACTTSEETLPKYVPSAVAETTTPVPCAKDATLFSCYKSASDALCITQDKVCNFVKDCPAGEDEDLPFCAAPSITKFSNLTSLDNSGWISSGTSKYQFAITDPKNIQAGCLAACPNKDSMGGTGKYVAADSSKCSDKTCSAVLSQKWPAKSSGPQCQLVFSYYFYRTTGSGLGVLSASISSQQLWSTRRPEKGWRIAKVPIGRQTKAFTVEIKAETDAGFSLQGVVAIGHIAFENCETAAQKDVCKPTGEFHCKSSQVCVDSNYLCDFSDDCGDGLPANVTSSSDELDDVCERKYVARCTFEEAITSCDMWGHESPITRWGIVPAKPQLNSARIPDIDHTTQTASGRMLKFNHNSILKGINVRFKSLKRFAVLPGKDTCRIRFWLHHYYVSGNLGSLHIVMRTSYEPLVETFIANFTSSIANAWVRQDIAIPAQAGTPFEIVFLGIGGEQSFVGSLAVDDISLTPACQISSVLLPGQKNDPLSEKTETKVPTCKKCSNGNGCYLRLERCDFINQCSDASDEASCSKSCGFDDEKDWCNWRVSPDYQSVWGWSKLTNHAPEQGPTGDHTTGSGGYLTVRKESRTGERGRLVSTILRPGSPACTLEFWYYAYYKGPYIPSSLSVSMKFIISGKVVQLFNKPASEDDEWRQEKLNLYATESFEVRIDIFREHPYSAVAIDDLRFVNCEPGSGASQISECSKPTDFLCEDKSRCVSPSQICDFHRDCLDGSDEKACRSQQAFGTCTFEGPTWQKLCGLKDSVENDTQKWQAGPAGGISHGPVVDHTFGTAEGRVIYVDTIASDSQPSEQAMLTTGTVYPANNARLYRAAAENCFYRFFFYMYRAKGSRGHGKLKVVTQGENTNKLITRAEISLLSIDPGRSTTDLFGGETWIPISVPIGSSEPFRIFLVAETDDSPLSVIAVDDVIVSSGCVAEMPTIDDKTGCPADSTPCSMGNLCVPKGFVCDKVCDCPWLPSGRKTCSDEAGCPGAKSQAIVSEDLGQVDSGLVAGLSVVTVCAVAAIATAVYFYRKSKRGQNARNIEQTGRVSRVSECSNGSNGSGTALPLNQYPPATSSSNCA